MALPLSDELLLCLLLGLFYALECFSVVGKTAICLRPRRRMISETVLSSCLASGDRNVVGHGLFPFEQTFLCQPWPWPLNEHGVLLPIRTPGGADEERPPHQLRLVPFAELADLSVAGSDLICGQGIRLPCPSPRFAQTAWSRLCQVRDAPRDARSAVIQHQIRTSFEGDARRQDYRRFRSLTCSLRLTSTAWVLWTLGSLALGGFWPQTVRSEVAIPIVIAGFLLFWMLTAGALIRANRVLRVSQGREWRQHLCQLLLTPTAAMRSPDWLSRHRFLEADPLAVAATLERPRLFRELAQQRLLALLHPLPGEIPATDDSKAVHAFAEFRWQVLQAMEHLIHSQGILVEDLLAAPPRDFDAQSYCPRCRGQSVRPAGPCPACPGISLRSFAGQTASAPATR